MPKLPTSQLYCARCNAPLGVRWNGHSTITWYRHVVGDVSVHVCSPCKGELMTGNHAPRRKMHNKPLIGQLNLFSQEQVEVVRKPIKRKRKQNA